MARVKTKEALRDYLKISMGAPTIVIELTDDQLDLCIDRSIERYAEYGYDGMKTKTLLVDLVPNQSVYVLPDDVIAITGLQANSTYSSFINIPAGYTLAMNPISLNLLDNVSNIDIQSMTSRMAKMSNLRSLFDVQVNFDFNFNSKELTFFETPISSTVVLEMGVDYEPDEIDNIYNNWWIKKRALGEAYFAWSGIVGKYSNSLINGSSLNYDDMRSKGEQIIQETDEELLGLFEALPLYVF